MKFDKIILLSFILLVLFFSITAISASGFNCTDDISEDILKDASSDKGSYKDLSDSITAETSTFSLEKNYTYDDAVDSGYSNGISLKNNIIIQGNNHVIDGNNKARAFNVSGHNVTINNLIIRNAVNDLGSAIFSISNLTLNNVTFINWDPTNNSQSVDGCGAIVTKRSTLNVNNCKFIDTYGMMSINYFLSIYD